MGLNSIAKQMEYFDQYQRAKRLQEAKEHFGMMQTRNSHPILTSQLLNFNHNTSKPNETMTKSDPAIPVSNEFEIPEVTNCEFHSEFAIHNVVKTKDGNLIPACPNCLNAFSRNQGLKDISVETVHGCYKEAGSLLKSYANELSDLSFKLNAIKNGKHEFEEVHRSIEQFKTALIQEITIVLQQYEQDLMNQNHKHDLEADILIVKLEGGVQNLRRQLETQTHLLNSKSYLKTLQGMNDKFRQDISHQMVQLRSDLKMFSEMKKPDFKSIDAQLITEASGFLKKRLAPLKPCLVIPIKNVVEEINKNSEEMNKLLVTNREVSSLQTPLRQSKAYSTNNKENQPSVVNTSSSKSPSKKQVKFNEMIKLFAINDNQKHLVLNTKEDSFVNMSSSYLHNYFEHEAKKFLHFFDVSLKSLFVKILEPVEEKDKHLKQLIIPNGQILLHEHCSLSTPSGDLFVIGGVTPDDRASGSFMKLNWLTHALDKMPEMLTPRSNSTAIWFKNCVYVFGGRTNHGPTSSCEKFIIARNEWVQVSSMYFDAERPSACIVNERNVGVFHTNRSQEVFIQLYDPQNDDWSLVRMDLSPQSLSLNFASSSLVYQIFDDVFFYLELKSTLTPRQK